MHRFTALSTALWLAENKRHTEASQLLQKILDMEVPLEFRSAVIDHLKKIVVPELRHVAKDNSRCTATVWAAGRRIRPASALRPASAWVPSTAQC